MVQPPKRISAPCTKRLGRTLYSCRYMALASLIILPFTTNYAARSVSPQIVKSEVRVRIVRGVSASDAVARAKDIILRHKARVEQQVSKRPCPDGQPKDIEVNKGDAAKVNTDDGCTIIIVDNY